MLELGGPPEGTGENVPAMPHAARTCWESQDRGVWSTACSPHPLPMQPPYTRPAGPVCRTDPCTPKAAILRSGRQARAPPPFPPGGIRQRVCSEPT